MTSKFATVIGEADFKALEESIKTPQPEAKPVKKKLGGLRKGLGTVMPAAFKFSEDDSENKPTSPGSESMVALDLAFDSVWDNELKNLGDATSPNAEKKKKANPLLKKLAREKKEVIRTNLQFTTARDQDQSVEIVEKEMSEVYQNVKARTELTKVVLRCVRRKTGPDDAKDGVLNIEVASNEDMITEIRLRGSHCTIEEMQENLQRLTKAFSATGHDGVLQCTEIEPLSPDTQNSSRDLSSAMGDP